MILNADARQIPLADGAVHCVVTSPPYWGLRDYGTARWVGGAVDCDHRSPSMRAGRNEGRATLAGSVATNQAQLLLAHRTGCGKCGAVKMDDQLGLEPTPEEYVANMVAVFREVWRVLRDDGTLWLNLGDSYATNGGAGYQGKNGQRADRRFTQESLRHRLNRETRNRPGEILKPKDLVGIPWRVAFALQADGWYLRSDIIWSKPNPMPESVTDRPTKAHEYLFLLAKSERYYYDAEAVKEASEHPGRVLTYNGTQKTCTAGDDVDDRRTLPGQRGEIGNPISIVVGQKRNRRSVWEIATQPYPEAHFATFPEALVEPCILAGTSEYGCCGRCGAPWERMVEKTGGGGPNRERMA